MKTRKYKLTRVAMGVALAMGSMSALAQQPVHPAGVLHDVIIAERASLSPALTTSDMTGLAGVESALSLIAARVHIGSNTSCAAATYTLDVSAFDRDGTVTIDDGAGNGGAGLSFTLTPSAELIGQTLGTQVDVQADPGSKLHGVSIINSTYAGSHQWSNSGGYIFLDSADWVFSNPAGGAPIAYDEHSIKDYFSRTVSDEEFSGTWIFDWGLEVITKRGYPVNKWTELSWYHKPDGSDGFLRVRKDRVSPGNNQICRIIYEANSFVDGAFDFSGTVQVTPLNGG